MDAAFERAIEGELEGLRQAGTYRTFRTIESPQAGSVRLAGRGEVIVLSSNNYLGLANHPEVIAAATAALQQYGAGTASVRFICGTFAPHLDLERAIADFLGCAAATTYSSCWDANEAVVTTLADETTAVLSDQLNHASIIDAIKLSKAAKKVVYRHADMDDLRRALQSCRDMSRKLIVTDGVFSMEGDLAPLPAIVELAREFGALVIVDDSHGVGVLGEAGSGTPEHFGLRGEIDILTGTLGKSLGGAPGGYVAGSDGVCDLLTQRSRPQLFSNSISPATAAGAKRAIELIHEEPNRLNQLRENCRYFKGALESIGLKPLPSESAILPIIVGDTAFAIRMSDMLLEKGIFVTGFGFPVVPEGTARIRVQMSAALTTADLDRAIAAFEDVAGTLGLLPN